VIVVTDELAGVLDDDHVAAVLAHEVAHLQHRHGTRHILQDTIAGLVLLAVFGDASSVATVAATAPAILLNNAYSRDFEREADARAFELLRRTGRSPKLLGTALAALEQHHERKAAQCRPDPEPNEAGQRGGSRGPMGYISTHPATAERIRAAEEAALKPF
jgi:Zn-dependent protease with chaperone function